MALVYMHSFHKDDNGVAFKNVETHFEIFVFSGPQDAIVVEMNSQNT